MGSIFNLNVLSPVFMHPNESLAPVLFCLFVSLILPRLKTGIGTLLTLALLAGFVSINLFKEPFSDFWPRISFATLILIGGYFIVVAYRVFKTKKDHKKTSSDLNENDKTLGLFYQQQGMLDLAFEKYQSIPREEEADDLLYSLGLEYEKRGLIHKALDVYKYMFTGQRCAHKLDEKVPVARDVTPDETIGHKGDRLSTAPLKTDDRSTIGRYRVSKEMGKDSMGVVFRGQDPDSGKHVAIKTVEFSRLEDDISEIRGRFFRETECLRQLIHPNILTVYDCGEAQGIFYLVTDDFDGENLKEYTKKNRLLPIREALSIIAHAADALDYAHRKNVIHQNVRPDSIIWMKASGDARVKDFGLGWFPSALKSENDSLNEAHFYVSPEQIAGKKVDARSDVFSLGIVLFEMLTGERPFEAEDMPSIMLKISKEIHPSPRFYNPKIPKVIEKIIDRALEKDPEKRYQSAGQMAIHLKKVIARINELMEQKRASNPLSHAHEHLGNRYIL